MLHGLYIEEEHLGSFQRTHTPWRNDRRAENVQFFWTKSGLLSLPSEVGGYPILNDACNTKHDHNQPYPFASLSF